MAFLKPARLGCSYRLPCHAEARSIRMTHDSRHDGGFLLPKAHLGVLINFGHIFLVIL